MTSPSERRGPLIGQKPRFHAAFVCPTFRQHGEVPLFPNRVNLPILCAVTLSLWATAASAIDCPRARTPPERAICGNPALKAFDDYLGAAYAAVRKAVPPAVFEQVRKEQIRWIRERDEQCEAEVRCLMKATQARTAVLNGFAQRHAESRRSVAVPRPVKAAVPRPAGPKPPPAKPAGPAPLSPTEIYRKASDSVVVVVGFDPEEEEVSQGSGVVIGKDRVATNCHVVESGSSVAVFFRDRSYPASVVVGDENLDYCIVRAAGLKARPADTAGLRSVRPGQRAYTIGSPRGLELTIAEGLVSGIRKQDGYPLPLIQTSAPISPGSSGGGLFDEFGRVIGITTFLVKDSQNLNFALPVEMKSYLSAHGESAAAGRSAD
jgi:uncharacterized protein